MKSKECIVLYNIQPRDREQQIQNLVSRLGMPYKIISPASCEETLGTLLGATGFPPVSGKQSDPLPGEMMILQGLSSLRLETLLQSFRSAGIAPVKLKAVVTETNIHWSLKTLYGHLLLEHMQMNR